MTSKKETFELVGKAVKKKLVNTSWSVFVALERVLKILDIQDCCCLGKECVLKSLVSLMTAMFEVLKPH